MQVNSFMAFLHNTNIIAAYITSRETPTTRDSPSGRKLYLYLQ